MKPLAARFPGWMCYLRLAEARFELIRGDLAAAKLAFEHCFELSAAIGANGRPRKLAIWLGAHAGHAETLLALGEPEQARASALAGMIACDEQQIDSHVAELRRVLALAEARLGDVPAAIGRLESMIERQVALGVTGLKLGLSYETRVQVAIWTRDEEAFETYARLCAREYRHGAGCSLGARYESLMNEALRCGFASVIDLSDFESNALVEGSRSALHNITTMVSQAMAGTRQDHERARRALRLVCDARAAQSGHLYVLRPGGLVLAASHGPAAPEALVDLAREYVTQEL